MRRNVLAKKAPVYNEEERNGLRVAGRFNAQLMDFIRPHVQAGVTTNEIDRLVHGYTLDHGPIPACLGYKGFPKSVCTSVNEVVCHGIPDDAVLREGEIVNVDLTTIVNGWYGDQSETFTIGEVAAEARRLVQVTFDALYVGIRAIEPFGRVYDIGRAIYEFATERGYGVVREYQGHGLGREFHQKPDIPHMPEPKSGRVILKPGNCFTVEPMLNCGSWRTVQDKQDGWTVRTKDRRLSAQFEHTILMTEDGPEITTLTQHGPQAGHNFLADMPNRAGA
ncbi:MAG: type I methionyl aminopeptidase [Planctomycetes bacterium]|nr:type I methionyl aminopeptidase [Planctomycetota bacterium]